MRLGWLPWVKSSGYIEIKSIIFLIEIGFKLIINLIYALKLQSYFICRAPI